MGLFIPVLMIAALILTWLFVARYYSSMGHSKIASNVGGVMSGILAAVVVLLVTAPGSEQEPDTWMLEETAETTASEPSPQEMASAKVELSREEAGPAVIPPFDEEMEMPDLSFGGAAEEPDEMDEPPLQESMKIPAPSVPKTKPQVTPAQMEKPAGKKAEPAKPAAQAPPPPKKTAEPQEENKSAFSSPYKLNLTATAKEVWIKVSIDNGADRRIRLAQGESVTWTAKRSYVLTVDNAGGLQATLNGKHLSRFGPEGHSRANIHIPPHG
jgi:hypothetical protein